MGPNYIGLDKGYFADSAITQFRAVKLITTGTNPGDRVTIATSQGEAVIGVAQHAVAAADAGKQQVNIRMAGITKMESGGAITLTAGGTKVRVDASGRAVALAGTAGTNENVVGLALTGAAGTGEWVDVYLTLGVANNTATT